MVILGIGLGVLCVALFVALFVWVRRSERDIDYAEMRNNSTQTDAQRQAKQVVIGLVSGPVMWGGQ